MFVRRWAFVCSIFACSIVMSAGAIAQSPLALPGTAPAAPPPAQPAAPAPAAAPKVDAAEIVKRANQAAGADIDTTIKSLQKALDRIEDALRRPNLKGSELNPLRDELLKLRANAEELSSKLQQPLEAIEGEFEKLPPAPAQGQPPEPDPQAQYRAEITYNVNYLRSARGALDRTHGRIDQFISAIQDIRRKNFANNLFQPVTGMFSAQTWQTAPEYAWLAANQVRTIMVNWWQSIQDRGQVLFLAGAGLVLWLILGLSGFIGIGRLRRWKDDGEPPFWRRATSAAGVILLRSLPTVTVLIFLYYAVDEVQAMPNNVGWLFYTGARALVTIVVVNALIATVLSPSDHRWRLIPASNGAAVRISGLVLTLALVYSATTFVYIATRIVHAPLSLTLALALPSNTIVALLVLAILKTPIEEQQIDGLPSLRWLRMLSLPAWLIAAAIIVTALSGYLRLSQFIAQQLIVTGTILAVVYLLFLWADGIAQAMGDETSGVGSWLKTTALLDQTRRERLAVPVSLLSKFTVLICSVPLILLQWGYPWADIMELYHQLFFGFHIGNTQVSLAAILASVVVFILGYFAAKFFQQWLDIQILKPAGLSGGLRDSIRTGVGYLGVSAAALIALSYAGFNLSNLAIVAGAFSVGIGFGLQSVVNNFVSGLILLAERPIKVGDLVVVGGEEGYVRKISVRSTEIETSDRANVLIPNSYFISEKVKNWTLRNNTGRVAIGVGVAQGSDPRKVKAILLQTAHAHPNVMRSPEPFVDFEEFGDDTFDFKLYAFVYDLEKSAHTRTDLRIAILDAFKAAGIVLPSRQTDITMRDIEWLRDAVKLYMANAAGAHPGGNGSQAHAKAADAAE
ncbi:MAG: mechanosensitive ion channel family protein [Rhodomicrobium sp.]